MTGLRPAAPCFQIALCPPSDCGKVQCRSHWADRKAPSECGIDTVSAPIGTSYRLVIAVFDSRGANATAERTIAVVSPCNATQDYCEEAVPGSAAGATRWVCSDVSCAERSRLATLAAAAGNGSASGVLSPRLFLLPGYQTTNLSLAEADQAVFLAYRTPAPFSLAPCAAFADGAPPAPPTCAAIANDTLNGDLTAAITTVVVPRCAANTSVEEGTCTGCSVAALTTGTCLPGRYSITYTVAATDGNGGSASASRRLDVAVEQLTTTIIELNLFPNRTAGGSTNVTVAEAFAASLLSNSTARAALLAPVMQVFGITPSTIRNLFYITPPTVVPVYPSGATAANGTAGNNTAAVNGTAAGNTTAPGNATAAGNTTAALALTNTTVTPSYYVVRVSLALASTSHVLWQRKPHRSHLAFNPQLILLVASCRVPLLCVADGAQHHHRLGGRSGHVRILRHGAGGRPGPPSPCAIPPQQSSRSAARRRCVCGPNCKQPARQAAA